MADRYETIDDLVLHELRYQGVLGRPLRKLAQKIRSLEAEAWKEHSEANLKGNDSKSAYELGRAHALCAVLGDQSSLSMQGAFDEE